MENNIVVMSDIAMVMAKKSGLSEDICSRYVKELFLLVEDTLNETGTFTIEGIGNFSNTNGCIQFTPDDLLAKELNSAFECFEPVELDTDVANDLLEEPDLHSASNSEFIDKSTFSEDEREVVSEEDPSNDKTPVLPPPIPEEDRNLNDNKISDESQSAAAENPKSSYTESDSIVAVDSILNSPIIDPGDSKKLDGESREKKFSLLSFILGVISGAVVCAVVILLGFGDFLSRGSNKNESMASQKIDTIKISVDNEVEKKELTADNAVSNIDKKPSLPEEGFNDNDKPQYYKVTESSYLSNISRKYYGHYAFWIYIYIENKDKIKDPDNLPIGMVLTIPAKEKYGIDKNDKKSIERAELKAVELFGDK